MKALGFGDPKDSVTAEGHLRCFIGLKALPTDHAGISKLPPDVFKLLKSRKYELEQEIIALEGAPSISAIIREMKTSHHSSEIRDGIETTLVLVNNILLQPKDIRVYRVKASNPAFQRTLGRLIGSEILMNSIGFVKGPTGEELGSTSSERDGPESFIYYLKTLGTENPALNANKKG